MAEGICVAVVTMSPQSDLIHEVLLHVLPAELVKRIVIRGSDGGWDGGHRRGGKQAHIASAIEEVLPVSMPYKSPFLCCCSIHCFNAGPVVVQLQRMGQCSTVRPNHVVLVDDDPENIAAALRGSMHAVWCPADGGTDTIAGAVLSALAALPHQQTLPASPHAHSSPLSPERRTPCSPKYVPPGALHNTPSSADGLVLTPNGWRLGDTALAESPHSPLGLASAEHHRSPLSPPHSPMAISVAGLSIHGPSGYSTGSPYSPVRGVIGSTAGMPFRSPPGSPSGFF